MDELKNGAMIHVYRSSREGLRAFISKRPGDFHSTDIRITTVFALRKKDIIAREKPLDYDDWAGEWTLKK